jgi:hypothetical protein
MLRTVFTWMGDTLDNAKNLGVAQIVGLFFVSAMFGVEWILLGEGWARHYDHTRWTAFRHECFPFIPDIMVSGSLGNFLMLWLVVILALLPVGALLGLWYFAAVNNDEHYKFVLEAKDQCQGAYLENGLLSIAISEVNGSGGTVSTTALLFLSARNFLTFGVTRYATPFFLALNTVFGSVVMAMLGTVAFAYPLWIVPIGWARWQGTFVGNQDMAVFAMLGMVIGLPIFLAALLGLLAGVLNALWMGLGFMGWVMSFLPSRWKARRAYRLRAGDVREYLNADHSAREVDDNFVPITAHAVRAPDRVSLQTEVAQWN